MKPIKLIRCKSAMLGLLLVLCLFSSSAHGGWFFFYSRPQPTLMTPVSCEEQADKTTYHYADGSSRIVAYDAQGGWKSQDIGAPPRPNVLDYLFDQIPPDIKTDYGLLIGIFTFILLCVIPICWLVIKLLRAYPNEGLVNLSPYLYKPVPRNPVHPRRSPVPPQFMITCPTCGLVSGIKHPPTSSFCCHCPGCNQKFEVT